MKAPHLSKLDNFYWLLIALVFLLLAEAIFSQFESEHGRLFVNLSLLLTLFVAVWSLERGRKGWHSWRVAITLLLACLLVGESMIQNQIMAIGQLTGCFIFLGLSLYLVSRQVLFTGTVDTNKIVGSICIYILMGLIWAFGYLIVEELFPGSFKGLNHEVWQGNLEQFTYYSMVTLTTVGYGDITPALPVARFLAYMEGITGIFFTTVLVASLIGVKLADIPGAGRATHDSLD